jgi:hypothetical protein
MMKITVMPLLKDRFGGLFFANIEMNSALYQADISFTISLVYSG